MTSVYPPDEAGARLWFADNGLSGVADNFVATFTQLFAREGGDLETKAVDIEVDDDFIMDYSKLTIGKFLGKGAFGAVMSGTHDEITPTGVKISTPIAIKEVTAENAKDPKVMAELKNRDQAPREMQFALHR